MKKIPLFLLIKIIIFAIVFIASISFILIIGKDNWFAKNFCVKIIFSAGNIATIVAVILSICGISIGKKRFTFLCGVISIFSLVITISSFINLKCDEGESLAQYIGNWFVVTIGIFIIASAIFAIISCIKLIATKKIVNSKIFKKITYNSHKLSKTDDEYIENEDYSRSNKY